MPYEPTPGLYIRETIGVIESFGLRPEDKDRIFRQNAERLLNPASPSEHRYNGLNMGTAYGLPAASYRSELILVSAGTPCGEFLRRYWHPVAFRPTPRSARVRSAPSARTSSSSATAQGARAWISAMRASRHQPLLWACRGAGHPLLLPRMVIRCRGPLPGAAL